MIESMLLAYNPQWLCIGLKTVLDETIPTHNYRTFIRKNLLTNEAIAAGFGYRNVLHYRKSFSRLFFYSPVSGQGQAFTTHRL
jgi:hypothetical protein